MKKPEKKTIARAPPAKRNKASAIEEFHSALAGWSWRKDLSVRDLDLAHRLLPSTGNASECLQVINEIELLLGMECEGEVT